MTKSNPILVIPNDARSEFHVTHSDIKRVMSNLQKVLNMSRAELAIWVGLNTKEEINAIINNTFSSLSPKYMNAITKACTDARSMLVLRRNLRKVKSNILKPLG